MGMRKIIATGILALTGLTGLTGCGQTDYCDSFRLEGSWSEQQIEIIHQAGARFASWSGREVEIRPDGQCYIAPGTLDDAFAGMFYHSDGHITIDLAKMATEEALEWSIMHEMAHASGMHHIPVGEYGLMSSTTEGLVWSFTTADEAECKRAGLCQDSDAR